MDNAASSRLKTTELPSAVEVTALVVMRLALGFWIGAAVLFIITSIAEQKFPAFDSMLRDQLATIRFPFYYAFGISCCTAAIAAGVICRNLSRHLQIAMLLTTLAAVVFALDYWFVYRLLQELIIPAGSPRTEQFEKLHTWSRNVNSVHLLLVLIAAVQAGLPVLPVKHHSG
ncbi:MAG: hypothetical protein MK110_05075 [Fuerstiella sp.]|nr:hypothetical protein [Fuerstiella sp.]